MRKLGLLIILGLCVQTHGQYDPEARKVLDAMSSKYRNANAFTASFNQKIENTSAGLNEDMQGKITVKKEMYKLEILDRQIYNNGKEVWVYSEELQEATLSEYDPEEEEITPGNVYDLYKKGFKYALIQELSNGDKVIELDPISRDKSYHKIRLTISSKNELKTFVVFEKSGTKYTYRISDFKTSSSIGSSVFSFDPKKHVGVDVVCFLKVEECKKRGFQ